MIITLALDASSSMQLVHLAPAMAMSTARMASRMETTVRARAACRSWDRASMESYTLHCICPVLCTTQVIHRPSQMICAVTMLLPMNAVTLHMGRAHAAMAIIHPRMPREMPINSSPTDILTRLLLLLRRRRSQNN